MKLVTFKRGFWLICWGALALSSYRVSAESVCIPNVVETANADAFEEVNEGEMVHLASNLVFMRCSIGQRFQDDECLGEPSLFTWQEALNLSLRYEYANAKNWRLPNIKELAVIVERACVRPAINEEVFPGTAIDDVWTSTPSMQDLRRAWFISFANGTSSIKRKDRELALRLVRTHSPNQ
jgi:hypothetical protein